MIIGIDPGHIQTAFVVYQPEGEVILYHGIMRNENFLYEELPLHQAEGVTAAVEMVAGYGMPVGKEVFETVMWIGRMWEKITIPKALVYRKDIKIHLCGTTRAKDGNIRQALIDRFGAPGVKRSPGKTYGLRADEWAALAVATYYADTKENANGNPARTEPDYERPPYHVPVKLP